MSRACGLDPGLSVAGLTAAEWELVARRAAHGREVLTGYGFGHADAAGPGEPRPEFAPDAMATLLVGRGWRSYSMGDSVCTVCVVRIEVSIMDLSLSRRSVLLSGTAVTGASLLGSMLPSGAAAAADAAGPGQGLDAVRGDRAGNWLEQTRSEVLARNGIVATSQPLAAQAGVEILRGGGTAADAAVAAAAMLAVVEPYSHGLGGDTFVLYYSARARRLFGLNASGWAPRAWTPEYFAQRGHEEMPLFGVDTVTVPGAVDGWHRLLTRFGRRGFRETFAPAVRTAEQGFGVTERIAADWANATDEIRKDRDAAETFLPGGKAPELYRIFRNPGLARALRQLQHRGRDAFYTGDLGATIVAKIRAGGGAMSEVDLAGFQAEWVEPISVGYHGYEVFQIPPNAQGFATLEMLNIVEAAPATLGVDLRELGPRSVDFWHLLIEAKKLAYSDLHAFNGDPRFAEVPLEMLLSKEHGAELCGKIDMRKAGTPDVPAGASGGTVYVTAADRWGNMCSFISSVFEHFGSGVGVPGYGFVLHNRGALFTLDSEHPNVVAPRKRPFHTIIPAFVMRDGAPVLSFGNMGGSMQPQAQAQELVNIIDLGMNVQAAGDAARFRHDQGNNRVRMESNLYELVGRQLADRGHAIAASTGSPMGGYQAIMFQPDPGAQDTGSANDRPVAGLYRAGSDHRKDGAAIGW